MFRRSRPMLLLVLFGCVGCYRSPMNSLDAGPADPADKARTPFSVVVVPERAVDILFMVDNSPSMDPKQTALAQNFPKMIQQLQKVPDGLPDVHIGVITSDFGAGGGEMGSNCGIPLGNRGLLWGNDSSANAIAGLGNGNNQFATVAGGTSKGCGLNPGVRWIEDVQYPDGSGRQKNYSGNLADVFSCLALAVGTRGCGEEHQLQSIRVALNPASGINDANVGFLRPRAYLAIVMITDEDDCSADPYSTPNDPKHPVSNDNLFSLANFALSGEGTSLRCAGRGHVCNGKAIPNYDPSNGYDGSKGPLIANFADCAAKEPKNPPDYHWLPLYPVETMVDAVIAAKQGNKDRILVSGIIGWPMNGDLTGVQYRIDKDPTAFPVSQQSLWDYMPICSIPSVTSADGNIYKAYGGLRLKKFIDAFGDNGKIFSICNNDFTEAMTQIGVAVAHWSRIGCVDYPLVDVDPDTTGVQPDCVARMRVACDAPGVGSCLASGYEEGALPACMDAAGLPLAPDAAEVDAIPEASRPCWYLSRDLDPVSGCANSFAGQKLSVLRKAGQVAPAGTQLAMRCLVCQDASDPRCTP
jgi:hypothetical protein